MNEKQQHATFRKQRNRQNDEAFKDWKVYKEILE